MLKIQKSKILLGGQAVIEGVMIKSPSFIATAVRNPKGEIVVKKEPFKSLSARIKFLGLPILRGVINLFEMIAIGMKALDFSVNIAVEEQPNDKKTKFQKILSIISFTLSIIISLAFALFLFKFVPLFITEKLAQVFPRLKNSVMLFNLTDGLLRIFIFLLYIFLLSIIPYFRRVFEYHGAEHKAIFAFEKDLPLTAENVKMQSPRHPRCGTSFLIFVLIISILMFSLVPRHPIFIINFLRRIAMIPLIAGVGYEILKWSAKFEKNPLVKLLTYPGVLTQYITTKEPDEKEIEVAVRAVGEATGLKKEIQNL